VSESQAIPFWEREQLDLFNLMTQAIDPEERVMAVVQDAAPIQGRIVLDVGAGVGDRSIVYARLAAHVYALEPDPTALPILRGRIKSSGASNVTVVPASADAIPLEEDSVDVAYATWAYFFGPGSEPGLREVKRTVRPGGDFVVVQNCGHDELSQLWTPREAECETWPTWFAEHGFACEVVDTIWRFRTSDEAALVLGFLWGERARNYALENDQAEFNYRVAVYHRHV
jgi:ubiquinone/menaquinone biosynthesis C-methylase UbiE